MAVFETYEEIPVSRVVGWYRYAVRRSSYLRTWPELLRQHAIYTASVYVGAWLLYDSSGAMNELMSLLAAALASVLLVPLGQFVIYFITAGYGLLREENEQLRQQVQDAQIYLTELSKQLGDARKDRQLALGVASSLTVYREGAIKDLLNRRVTTDEELDQLKTDIASWEQRVLNYMEKSGLPPTKISNFRVLGLYANRVKGGYNSEHARELGMLLERLDRLLYMALEMEGPALNPSS